jgi:hypothetical protein
MKYLVNSETFFIFALQKRSNSSTIFAVKRLKSWSSRKNLHPVGPECRYRGKAGSGNIPA